MINGKQATEILDEHLLKVLNDFIKWRVELGCVEIVLSEKIYEPEHIRFTRSHLKRVRKLLTDRGYKVKLDYFAYIFGDYVITIYL